VADPDAARAVLTAIRDHSWPPGEPGPQAIGDLRRFAAVKQPVASRLGMLPYDAAELAGWLAGNLDLYDPADVDAITETALMWAPPGWTPPPPAADMPPRPRGTTGQRQTRRPRTATA